MIFLVVLSSIYETNFTLEGHSCPP